MRVLVIGGTGFLGSEVVLRLVRGDNEVCILHRGTTCADLPQSVQRIKADRRSLRDVAGEIQAWSPDAVLDTCAFDRADAVELEHALKGVDCHVVVLSSMDVYRAYGIFIRSEDGPPLQEPFDENAPLRSRLFPYRAQADGPDDLRYRYDKIPVEAFVLRELSQPATVLRLGKVYGQRDPQGHIEKDVQLIRGGTVRLTRARAEWRWSRIYVENAADAVCSILAGAPRGKRIYNVGDAVVPDQQSWLRAVAFALGEPVEFSFTAAEPDETYNWNQPLVADTRQFYRELSWTPPIAREEGIARTVAAR